MPDYVYSATDGAGNTVEGTIGAANSAVAAGKIRQMGYEPVRVRAAEPERTVPLPHGVERRGPAAPPERERAAPLPEHALHERAYAHPDNKSLAERFQEAFIYPVFSGVPLPALMIFYRQFATLIAAGVPLYQSLVTLQAQTKNAKLKEILHDCERQAESGGKISEVFSAYPWVFSPLQIEMLRAAEQGGMMERMFLKIADYLEQEWKMRQLLRRLTLYPKIVLFAAVMIVGWRGLTSGMPAFSMLVLGGMGKENYSLVNYLMDTIGGFLLLAIPIFLAVAVFRIFLFNKPGVREAYDEFKIRIPGIGSVVQGFALAKFGRAFAAMYESGLPLQTSLAVAGNACGNAVIRKAAYRCLSAAESGVPLSHAFRETGVFPPIVVDMLHTGEQTGNVDQMMNKMAEYLEGDAESRAHRNAQIFSAAVYLMVALIVAMAVVSFWSGYGAHVTSAAGGE